MKNLCNKMGVLNEKRCNCLNNKKQYKDNLIIFNVLHFILHKAS
jgi:hypothetical protein